MIDNYNTIWPPIDIQRKITGDDPQQKGSGNQINQYIVDEDIGAICIRN